MAVRNNKVYKMVLSAMFLAIALVLPLLTGQIPEIGKALCPMHIPVLLCGFFCGPYYGLLTGAIAPLLRSLIFHAPVMIPSGLSMCFELAAYGFVSGYLYKHFRKKDIVHIYIALIAAMLVGRAVMGIANVIIYGVRGSSYGWSMFMAGAFVNAVPGIIVQIILIPALVLALRRSSK